MRNSLVANLVLLLSLFHISVLAGSNILPAVIGVRQTTSDPACLDYSITANLSTIGTNSTYRSAFTQLSPDGTLRNQKLLNAAMAKLPKLTANADLNKQCGNLTTIALREAEVNFTKGVVGEFSGLVGNPQSIVAAGPELIAILIALLLCFGGVFTFMP